MARALTVAVLCVCLGLAFAADLRKLIEERANQLTPPAQRGGVAGKNAGDLDTANSWGWGPGFYGGWGGPWGYGPWGYGYGYGGWGGWGWGGWW